MHSSSHPLRPGAGSLNPGRHLRPILPLLVFTTGVLAAFGGSDPAPQSSSNTASDTTSPVTAAAPVSSWSVGLGFDFSRGDYGFPTDTEVSSFPLEATFATGAWLFRADLPFLRVSGPATVVVGGGSTGRPTSSTETGVGDLSLAATYQFGPVIGPVLGPVHLDATARFKVPTAEKTRGLGTGSADFAGELLFSRPTGALTPFLRVGYRVLGDNALYQLRDGANLGGGAHYRTSDRTVLTAAFDWRSRLGAREDNSAEAVAALTHDLNRQWQLLGYVLTGFTDASPDFGFGLHLSRRY